MTSVDENAAERLFDGLVRGDYGSLPLRSKERIRLALGEAREAGRKSAEEKFHAANVEVCRRNAELEGYLRESGSEAARLIERIVELKHQLAERDEEKRCAMALKAEAEKKLTDVREAIDRRIRAIRDVRAGGTCSQTGAVRTGGMLDVLQELRKECFGAELPPELPSRTSWHGCEVIGLDAVDEALHQTKRKVITLRWRRTPGDLWRHFRLEVPFGEAGVPQLGDRVDVTRDTRKCVTVAGGGAFLTATRETGDLPWGKA